MARFLLIAFLFSVPLWSQCISISDAPHHIGKKQCVAAKVLKVTENENGSFLLEFCGHATPCPFAVRVFPIDFDYVGDVRQLAGKKIEITGKIRERQHHAEIVLRDADQLKGYEIKLPPIPRTYDVEHRGNTYPGQFKGSKRTRRSHQRPATRPSDEIDDE